MPPTGKKSAPPPDSVPPRTDPPLSAILRALAHDKIDWANVLARFPGLTVPGLRERLRRAAERMEEHETGRPTTRPKATAPASSAKRTSKVPVVLKGGEPPHSPQAPAPVFRQSPPGSGIVDLALRPRIPIGSVEKVRVHIDGASKGNPGPAAIGVAFLTPEGNTIAEGGATLGLMTNNAAEYHALLAALSQALAWGATRVEIRTDSELLARQMNGQYSVKSPPLIPLFRKAQELRHRFTYCAIRHVPREENARADELANLAIDQSRTRRHPERP